MYITPYDGITLLPLNYFYVCHREENDKKLKEFIQNKNVKNIIEIGTFIGKSAIEMAKTLPEDGKITTIDNFQWQGNIPAHIGVYEQCLSNIIHENVQSKIEVLKMDHKQAYQSITSKVDLIYVDGDHSTMGCYDDLHNYYPLLTEDGVLCGDDWAYQCPYPFTFYVEADHIEAERSLDISTEDKDYPVRVAVKLFAKEHNLKIFSYGNFWWFGKNSF